MPFLNIRHHLFVHGGKGVSLSPPKHLSRHPTRGKGEQAVPCAHGGWSHRQCWKRTAYPPSSITHQSYFASWLQKKMGFVSLKKYVTALPELLSFTVTERNKSQGKRKEGKIKIEPGRHLQSKGSIAGSRSIYFISKYNFLKQNRWLKS